jgi:putative phosphoesterase
VTAPAGAARTIAIVADIHGNLPALRAVTDDILRRGIDVVINLGDHASGPLWPSETVALLMQKAWIHILGNCDRLISTALPSDLSPSDRFAFDRLGVEQRQWLAERPGSANMSPKIRAFHGTPTDDLGYLLETVDDGAVRLAQPAEIEQRLAGATGDVLLCAHSHVPRALRLGSSLIVNPGSVGLPAYETGGAMPHAMETGSPDARYAVLESLDGGWSAQLISVPYDHERAANQADRNGRPDWARALRTGFAT